MPRSGVGLHNQVKFKVKLGGIRELEPTDDGHMLPFIPAKLPAVQICGGQSAILGGLDQKPSEIIQSAFLNADVHWGGAARRRCAVQSPFNDHAPWNCSQNRNREKWKEEPKSLHIANSLVKEVVFGLNGMHCRQQVVNGPKRKVPR